MQDVYTEVSVAEQLEYGKGKDGQPKQVKFRSHIKIKHAEFIAFYCRIYLRLE